MSHLPGARLCADVLTKAVSRERFHLLLRLCELSSLHVTELGDACRTEVLRKPWLFWCSLRAYKALRLSLKGTTPQPKLTGFFGLLLWE